jgi:hypothetical protein
MRRLLILCLALPIAFLEAAAPNFALTQQVSPDPQFASLPPINDAATVDQIHEYLRLSGELASFRASWIAAVDKNRSIGAPYWPESFWAAVKNEMQNTDLVPFYVAALQHSVSKQTMQKVIDAYHRLGAEHFQGSPECFELGNALSKNTDDWEHAKLVITQQAIMKVYAVYKPQIKAARVRWMAEHPGWTDK